MDPNTLVEGGAEGLRKFAQRFRDAGADVQGVYLIKLAAEDGESEWVVRFITSEPAREMITLRHKLDRDRKLVRFFTNPRFDYITAKHPEAERIIAYANEVGAPTVVMENVGLRGMYFDYVLVGDYPRRGGRAAA